MDMLSTLQSEKLEKKSNNSDKPHFYLKLIVGSIENYLKQSTLHGLQYIGDNSLSLLERIFWIACFIFAGICAIYFTSDLYDNCNKNQVIVTMNSFPTPVQDVPFPAVTICNANSVKKNIANEILMGGTEVEKRILGEMCGVNSSTPENNYDENWIDRYKLMLKTHHPCREMLKSCTWHLNDIDCNRLFTTILTDEGYCCTFNQLPLNYILRYPLNHQEYATGTSLIRDSFQIEDWNPERGYSANAPFNVFPFRTLGRGRSLGLSIILDADSANYYCSTTSNSIGFKMVLHNPAEIQRVVENSFLLRPGFETNIDFVPDIADASEELREINPENRRCYFIGETHLKYYRTYTKANCKMECLTQTMLETCGCVLDYLPRNESVKICGKRLDHCNANVEEEIRLLKILNISSPQKKCRCYNGCATLSYLKHISYGVLTGTFRTKYNFFNTISNSYLEKNIAIVHIYLEDDHLKAYTTTLLCNFSNLISRTGGLLALFLGFSVLSIAEIFYYFTLKIICNVLRVKRNGKI